MRRRFPTLLAIVVLPLLVLPAAALATCHDSRLRANSATTARQAKATLCLINQQRATRGLPALKADPLLARAARQHARAMVELGFFDHIAPNGDSPVTRIRRTGYLNGARAWAVAENIAWGAGANATPAAVVQGWMQSPGHRAAILDPRFSQLGLGVAVGLPVGGTGVTVTADFGTLSRTSNAPLR